MDKVIELIDTIIEGKDVLEEASFEALFGDVVDNSQYCDTYELLRIQMYVNRLKRFYRDITSIGDLINRLANFFETVVEDSLETLSDEEKDLLDKKIKEYSNVVNSMKVKANLSYEKNRANLEEFLNSDDEYSSEKYYEILEDYRSKMADELNSFYDYESDLMVIDSYIAKTSLVNIK